MRAAKVDANQAEIVAAPWRCRQCGLEKRPTVHQMRAVYCSKACMAAGYSERMVGSANPNYSDAAMKLCLYCGGDFHSYAPGRKYCSHRCYSQSRPRKAPTVQLVLKLPKPVREKPAPRKRDYECAHCHAKYEAYPSAKRLFCSYACFTTSGGPFRAGLASAAAVMKYGARKDANHAEVFAELRKHCAAYDLSDVGRGIPDGVAWIGGAWRLFDVKNPKTGYGRRGLNDVQKKWLLQWKGGPVYLIHSVDEARKFGQGLLDGITVFHGCEAVAIEQRDGHLAIGGANAE